MRKHAIKKRTVACIVALALVFSCILTTYAGSIIPFTGDSGDNQTWVDVTQNGGRVWVTIGDAAKKPSYGKYRGPATLGTLCKVEAEDFNNRVFLYWQDEYTGRVYSYDRVVEFIAGSHMHLRAIYAPSSAEEHWVAYINYGGTILKDGSGQVGNAYSIGTVVMPPADTNASLPGFTFTGWTKVPREVADSEDDQLVYPQYTVNDESYTVTLTDETYASGAGTYSNFQTVNLKAEEKNGSGESFSYWKDASGAIVSYERNYSFRINYNVTLTPVFGENVTPEPVIRISKIYRDIGNTKITFFAERSVPETYTVVSHGMLLGTNSKNTIADSQMTIGSASESESADVRKAYGTTNELCGTFSLAKAGIARTREVVVRPFIIVKDADGQELIVYGGIVRTTNSATD